LKANMEKAQVPIRDEWSWSDYQALPRPDLDPVHEEPAEYDLYAITFKDVQMNFGESLTNPWIKDIVYNDPVHTALLLNTRTAAEKGLEPGDIVHVQSPYGEIYGRIATTEGMHPDTLGVSNSLSRMASQHKGVPFAGGHFNDMLPNDLRHTDAVSGQTEGVCAVKLTRIDDWPEHLKGNPVFDREHAREEA